MNQILRLITALSPPAAARLAAILLLAAIALPAAAQFGQDSTFGAPRTSGETSEPEKEVTASLLSSREAVTPGGQFAVAVVFDMIKGWHINPQKPVVPEAMGDFTPIPTTIELPESEGVTFGPIQWPETHEVEVRFTGSPVMFEVYEGEARAFIPIVVSPDAEPGTTIPLEITVGYQACDDVICKFPETETLAIEIPVVAAGEAAASAPANVEAFRDFDIAVFARTDAWSEEIAAAQTATAADTDAIAFNVFGLEFSIDAMGPAGFVVLLLIAALGGALLNLTPCVLPVIPIKIMGLSHAAGNPKRTLMLGVVMSLGVISFWLAIGGAIAFISGFTAISSLFQRPAFSILVGLVIGLMGLGMIGLFTIRLPKFVYMVNPSHETVHGSFLFGIMTAVLSTPCTAPFMGAASAWAATQAPWVTMTTFAAIGLGMALPYLLLSANPNWVSKVPRTGPASELVKQVMGLFMFAVAAFFFGIGLSTLTSSPLDPPSKAHWWVVAVFVALAGGWMLVRTVQITKKTSRRVVFGGLGVLFGAAAFLAAAEMTAPSRIEWIYYEPDLLAEARERGDVVMVDFTAEWCLNCKALESTVLYTDAVVEAIQKGGVVPMKVDLTGDNPDGRALLTELDWVGIPLLAFYGPALEEPLRYGDGYTIEMVRNALERARGGGGEPVAAAN